ncbi:MAG TPA: hypothetical protein VED37_13505, partial [Ktedonobacteraceae bacterium]|nr:hypothetical protein [Ktedonobacteraceae bacterium]
NGAVLSIDGAARPVLVDVADFKVFETSAELHFCVPFVLCWDRLLSLIGYPAGDSSLRSE